MKGMTTIGEDAIQKGCNTRLYLTVHRRQERGPGLVAAGALANLILPGSARIRLTGVRLVEIDLAALSEQDGEILPQAFPPLAGLRTPWRRAVPQARGRGA